MFIVLTSIIASALPPQGLHVRSAQMLEHLGLKSLWNGRPPGAGQQRTPFTRLHGAGLVHCQIEAEAAQAGLRKLHGGMDRQPTRRRSVHLARLGS